MADNNSSSAVSIVAIFAILLMFAVGGFLAWRAGVFGGHSGHKSFDVNVNTH
jgi:hypothetical protein